MELNLEGMLTVLGEQGFVGLAPDAQIKGLELHSEHSPAAIFEVMMIDDRVY